jgi:hypothetical protein
MAWYPLFNGLKTALLPGRGVNRKSNLLVILLLGSKRFLKKLDAFLHRGSRRGHGFIHCHFLLFIRFDHHSLRAGKNFSLLLVPNSKIRRFHVQGHWSRRDGDWRGCDGNGSGGDGDGSDGNGSGGDGSWGAGSGGAGDGSWGDGDGSWGDGDGSGGDGDGSGGDGDGSWGDGDWSWGRGDGGA